MREVLIRCSSLGKIMTEPKTLKEGPLSVGAKTYIRELAQQEILGVDFEFSSKETQKGSASGAAGYVCTQVPQRNRAPRTIFCLPKGWSQCGSAGLLQRLSNSPGSARRCVMRKTILALSIEAMLGGLAYRQPQMFGMPGRVRFRHADSDILLGIHWATYAKKGTP